MNEPFYKCACGEIYETREEWDKLQDFVVVGVSGGERYKRYYDHDGALVEQRLCVCGSHVTATLVPCLNVEQLRRAVKAIDTMREGFNTEYSAQELLRLVTICWGSNWDILPDEWTREQVARALESGAVPGWTESVADGMYHAMGVSDCPCGDCRRRRRKEDEEVVEEAVSETDG